MTLPMATSISQSYSLGMMSATGSQTTDEFVPGPTKKSLLKLNAEISKLRAIKAYTNADAEEKIEHQRETMETIIAETELKLRRSLEEHECVRMEIHAKEDGIKHDQKLHEETEEHLKMVEIDNETLYEQLNEIGNERKKWKKECEDTEHQLETLKTAINDMLLAQENIALTSKRSEDMLKIQSDTRMAALYKFLEEEGHRRKKLSDMRTVDGLKGTVNETVQKQKTYLRSICSSLGESSKESTIILKQYITDEEIR